MQEENTQRVDFSALRKAAGLSQVEAAKLSGYSPQAINGLENKDKGSKFLRQKLIEVYAAISAGDSQRVAPEGNATRILPPLPELTLEQWRERALLSEARLQHLKETCDTIGKHAQMLADTVQSLSRMISE